MSQFQMPCGPSIMYVLSACFQGKQLREEVTVLKMTKTHILLLAMSLAVSVALQSSQDKGNNGMKTAIIPRVPFGDAEKAIMLAYGDKFGLEVKFVLVRSATQAAELVSNGSVEIASAGIMTSYFLGRGRC